MLFYFLGCQKKNEYTVESNKLIFNHYYDNGNIDKILTYDLDTLLNGRAIFYYENGGIARKCSYYNGKLLGYDSAFYQSGNLYHVQQWHDSTLIHEQKLFYDSITPMLIEYEGDTSIIDYPLLKTYTYFNSYGNSGFRVEYDKALNAKNVSGNAIVSVFLDTLSTYDLTFLVALPPLLYNTFSIDAGFVVKEMGNKQTAIIIKDSKANYHFESNDSNKEQILIASYSLTNHENKVIYSDSIKLIFSSGEFIMIRSGNDRIEKVIIANLLD
jgi:hypothetical protein